MGDRDDGAGESLEVVLEPLHRLRIEMVGGLVEQQHVGLLEQHLAECHAPALTAGQPGHVRVGGRQPEGVHRDLELPLQLPRAPGVDLVLEAGLLVDQFLHLVVVGDGSESGVHLFEAAQQVAGVLDPLLHVATNVQLLVELRLLGEVADPGPLGGPCLPEEIRVDPGHDAEQRALPRAVGSDHADLRPREERQIDPLQDLPLRRDDLPEILHVVDELLLAHGLRRASFSGWIGRDKPRAGSRKM